MSWPAARRSACRSTRPRAAGCTSRPRRWSRTRWPPRRAASAAAKIKIGRPHVAEDVRPARRRCATAVGDGFEIMIDANQALHRRRGDPARAASRAARPRLVRGAAAGRRSRRPRPARRRRPACRSPSASRSTAVRISANICSAAPARSCRWTSRASAASRRGSRSPIWPRPSTSPVCPHFLMELHVSLRCAVPNGRWVEYIPQLDDLTHGADDDRGRPRGAARGAGARHRLGLGGDRGPARPRADAACRLSRIPGFRPPGAPS